MLILPHRQPLGLLLATVLICGTLEAAAAESKVEMERELAAARATELLLRSRPTESGDWEKLSGIYRDLTRRYPREPKVLNAYGALLWERGDAPAAEALFQKAETIAPGDAETLSHIGTVALANGEVRRAADLYTKACASAPEEARLHFDLGNLLFLFRHELIDAALPDPESVITKALSHYAEACRLAPQNVDFARGHAETFYGVAKPDWNAALAAWQHLLNISPSKDFARANLATVHLKLGQKDKAREYVAQMSSPEFAVRKARLAERIERE